MGLWAVEGPLSWLEALIDAGRLTPEETADKAAVALELAALIDERISLFRHDRRNSDASTVKECASG